VTENVDVDSGGAQFTAGQSVGEIARHLFDPEGSGVLIDVGALGLDKSYYQ
jgi:hypothetical protein